MESMTIEMTDLVLRLARSAVEGHVRRLPAPEIAAELADLPSRGVFVTIRDGRGELRGCMGIMRPFASFAEHLCEMAVAAASRDPRFERIAPAELAHLKIEVTVLGELEAIDDSKDLEIGRHGVYVQRGTSVGVLLPQVAEEYGWDAATFVQHACLKARLNPDDLASCELLRFEAQYFGEA